MTVPSGRLHFGRYETLFPIATGGMAEVYAARAVGEAGFQKLVALKRMKPELAEDARFVSMFLDEGRMAANISSPNVVSTLDLGRADDGSLFLVMELITGVSVANILHELTLQEARIPVEIAVEIIAQAANGLHDAHEARAPSGEPLAIVHRDCSPHNILIDVGGHVKITDFGIAKAMERQTQSQAGEMKGKLTYLSPEQARGYPVDRRADVFILGIVAWELLSQQRLFGAGSAVEVLHKVAAMEIPPLDRIRSDVSSDVAAAVGQALQRDANERFSTARAFGSALRFSLGRSQPTRAQLGQYIRDHGGRGLADMERQIRETFSTKSSNPGPSASARPVVEQPAPRAAPASAPAPSDRPAGSPQPAAATADVTVRPATDPSAAVPLGAPTVMDLPSFDSFAPPDTIPTEALQGIQIQLGPPPPESADDAPRASVHDAEEDVITLPTKRSFTALAIVGAVVFAIGGGVGAAWLLRSDASDRVEAEPEASVQATEPPTPPSPRLTPQTPTADALQPRSSAQERAEALSASDAEPSSPSAPHGAQRPLVNPRTVRGDRVPNGDRQAAFDEIPW